MSKGRLNIADIPDMLLKYLGETEHKFKSSTYLENFQSLETNLERVDITYKLLEKCNLFPVLEEDTKSDTKAKKQWAIGNKLFTDNHYLKALECYTHSITNASSKEVIAAGFANRSACLYKMQLYKECITDIDRALAKNYYPSDLRPKLLDRRSRAEKYFTTPERYYQDIPKIPTNRRHPTIQSARNCMEIRKNQRFGRHVVATRDIQVGEVICVEKCYAGVPKGAIFIHCHHCLELCYNPLPCPGCTIAIYCSEDCKNKAKKLYHKYFCPIALTLVACSMDPLHLLALKIIILAKDEIGKEEVDDGMYRSDRYKEMKELMPATKEMPPKQLMEKAVAAAIIYHLVKNHTTFFDEHALSERDFKDALLLQIQTTFLNHLVIYENLQNEKQYECEMFGVAMYSFLSLFNHSCCPNVDNVQYGSTNVLRATNTISKGSQLFINYNVIYDSFPVEFRQEYLSKSFYFNCKCEACEHNWMRFGSKTTLDPSLMDDLKMSETDVYACHYQLGKGDVEVARKFLKYILPHFKKVEKGEPFGNAGKMKELISTCYKTMGNRRRI